ncbi:MAG: sigma-54-dependent Fis family transcriptional regulator [Nitrospira sp.]|nr:sigma-54-dependent Fis family transcriptional regulator [Nitrospira sp.]
MDKILVVDDEEGIRYSFKKILGNTYTILTAANGIEAIELAGKEIPALVIMDISMPKMDGLETLQVLKERYPDITVIIMTAHSTSEKAINAMKHGAYDYITKPFENEQLMALIEKAIIESRISTPVTFQEEAGGAGDKIIGRSSAMLDIFKKIGQVSGSDVTVLITGETGTGKELIARAIYHHSDRIKKPFLPVNCAAMPEALLESELFGHEKGAFTGADNRKIGRFEQCDTGTMFLDEIGEMPPQIQAKWLRVLQDGCFHRLGGKDLIKTDVRIIAATNQDMHHLVEDKKFREDLFWRLNVVSIHIPPLRERRDDIESITHYLIHKYNAEYGKSIKGISDDLMKTFMRYEWPGNVRELQGVIQRGMVMCQKDHLSIDDCELRDRIVSNGSESQDLDSLLSAAADLLLKKGGPGVYKDGIAVFERMLINKALEKTGNNQVLTSRLLGISRNTLRSKIDN